MRKWNWAVLLIVAMVSAACGDETWGDETPPPKMDFSKPTLYVVGYAHLDTQWRWTYPQTIREFVRNTMEKNFPLIDKYPHYVFNFTGARRYQFMQQYFPDDFQKLQQYVKAGRWFPCGGTVDECDVMSPSGESIVRQILYGNQYFKKEFGVGSDDLMLPDCFGFNAAIPTIVAHCGMRGFSTQKLTWGSAVGIPFKVGTWTGPDGQSIIAALDPGEYVGTIKSDLSHSNIFLRRINQTAELSGLHVDYHYFGTGDRGGAPAEDSVKALEKSMTSDGPTKVIASSSYRMFDDITDEQASHLPKYKGELLLTNHSTGSLTSQSFMKRCNRKNELLADEAERASAIAAWLGGAPYPSDRLYNAWMIVLGSQMHDMMAGTAMANAYDYIWNDELLAMNQFGAIAHDACSAVIGGMDTQGGDGCIVVYNPLSFERQDVATADLSFASPDAVPANVKVTGPDGKVALSQIERDGTTIHLQFLADVPSVGFASYQLQYLKSPQKQGGDLSATEKTLENSRLRVTLDSNGDISSIYDKVNKHEALSAPARLAFLHEKPTQYPAWNMDWSDRQKPPVGFVDGPATVKVVESGPCRAALEVTREAMGSKFVQRISLADGDAGDHVEVACRIDWMTPESSLKASFPVSVANPMATYDCQVGVVQRGNNDEKKFEVPQQQWFDLTDTSGGYGVSILNDCKYGSDKPDDNTMRLTLLYSPGVRKDYLDQATQDFGRHLMTYAISPHTGDWRTAHTPQQAARLNQPLMAFAAPAHDGPLKKSFSFITLSSPQVAIAAIKKAEDSDDLVVRLRELNGQAVKGLRITAVTPILAACEVSGQEHPMSNMPLDDGKMTIDLAPFAYRAFGLRLAASPVQLAPPKSEPVHLTFDVSGVSSGGNKSHAAFDDQGETYPAEEFPEILTVDSVAMKFGPAEGKNSVACRGQKIALPGDMPFDHVHLVAAAVDEDQPADFKVGDLATHCNIQQWNSKIGQWDTRLWKNPIPEIEYAWHNNPCVGIEQAFVKPAEVAWYSTHRHEASGANEYYAYCYLFNYVLDAPSGAKVLTLPDNPKIRVFAISICSGSHDLTGAAQPKDDWAYRTDLPAKMDVSDPAATTRP